MYVGLFLRPGRYRRSLPCRVLVATLSLGIWNSAHAGATELKTGPVTITYAARPAGMSILWNGIVVSRHSELVVTTPPWAPHYYVGPTAEAVASAKTTISEDSRTLQIEHRGAHGVFVAHEKLVWTSPDTLAQTLECRFNAPEGEALVQWRAAALSPSLLMGRRFRIKQADRSVSKGDFPIAPQAEEPPIAHGFRRLDIDSRLGPLSIQVQGDQPLVLYDHRAGRWSNPDDPYFWFGDTGTRVRAGTSIKYEVIFRFPPAIPAKSDAPPIHAKLTLVDLSDALGRQSDDAPPILPTPKSIHAGNANALLSAVPKCSDESESPVWRLAEQDILRYWRDLDPAESAARPVDARLRFHRAATADRVRPQGYRLRVDPTGIEITAADTNGFLCAAQTLKQLSWRNREGHIEVRGVTVEDWPSLPFRGVHLFTGGQGPKLHEQLIRDVLLVAKINTLVLECEYIKWDAYPQIHHPQFGMSKDDARHIVGICRDAGIEIIPLVQSLGHCQWMFENAQNLDLAEDPDARYAYCVTNPRTYDFIFTVFQEALELFHPRIFHIGHDEYADRGRVPYREESRKHSIEELFMMDTLKLYDWLSRRGMRVMMWGDMLLAKGEAPDACHAASQESAARLRDQLPDDIVITDWHYAVEPPERFASLKTFQDAGHQVVASTWYRPGNIAGFARAAHQQQALGLLQTTWAGYSLDPESFARERRQYIAHVLAAEAAWNADRPLAVDLLDAGEWFFERMGMSVLPRGARSGWTADLAAEANVSLRAADTNGWFDLGPQHDLSALPTGDVRLRGIRFRVDSHEGNNALALSSKLSNGESLPRHVSLSIHAEMDTLVMLAVTEFACPPGSAVATLEAVWSNGEHEKLDLVYGHNIFAYTDLTPAPDAPVVWRGQTAGGEQVAVRALVWKLEETHRLRELVLSSADGASRLTVLGLTGLTSTR